MPDINIGAIAEALNNKVDLDSSWELPGVQYEDLTLGASGTQYTAPADGYIMLACTGTTIGSAFFEAVNSNSLSICASYCGGWGRAMGAIKKGQTFQVYYGGAGFTKQLFRFVYAIKSN